MTEREDDQQEWPLRDWSARLRPPGEQQQAEPAAEPEFQEQIQEAVAPAEPELPLDPVPPEAEPAYEPGYETVAYTPMGREEHAAGEFRVPGGYSVLEGTPAGQQRAVGVVVARFNSEITTLLLESALDELEEAGVSRDAILVVPVPGAFELPLAALALAKTRRYSCIVALGCVIRGETPHFDYVASEAASGLQLAAIETGVPVSFGVLTCDTIEQAEARVEKGAEAARSALEMADVFAQLRASAAAARAQ